MDQLRLLQIWLSLVSVARALVVQPVVSGLTLTEPSVLPNQSSSIDHPNRTWLHSDKSTNNLAVFCDGYQYGRDLLAADCRDALTGIPRMTQELRFGERSADPSTWDVGLPSRQIGGKVVASKLSLLSPPSCLTFPQYGDFARLNWSSSLAGHPLLLPHLMCLKLLSPY